MLKPFRSCLGSARLAATLPAFLLALMLTTLYPAPLAAQFYERDVPPASLRWRQVQEGPYKIVYPRGLDSLAFRYAFLFKKAAPYVTGALHAGDQGLPVILYPHTVNSNGSVAWTPKHMDLYTTPPVDGFHALGWDKSLVLHEVRHYAQLDAYGRGFYRPLSWLLGEQATGLSVAFNAPRWLLEGDAVMAETQYSHTGRGRDATFLMGYHALWDSLRLRGRDLPWDAWRYGSFKYVLPNHYAFGYLYRASLQAQTGEEGISGYFAGIRKTGNPYHLPRHFKRWAGTKISAYWPQARGLFATGWAEEDSLRAPFMAGEPLTRPAKVHEEWSWPVAAAGAVYALHRSPATPTRLVRIEEGSRSRDSLGKARTEAHLISPNGALRSDGKRLYWSSAEPDVRWGMQSSSVVYVYEPRSGKTRRLTRHSRYYQPTPSPDTQTLAVIHYSLDAKASVHFLAAPTGRTLDSLPLPPGLQALDLAWDGPEHLILLGVTDAGRGLYRLHRATGHCELLRSPRHALVRSFTPTPYGLVLCADSCDRADLWLLPPTPASGPKPALQRLTRARYGVFEPSYDPATGLLLFTEASAQGQHPRALPLAQTLADAPFTETETEAPGLMTALANRFSAQAGNFFADTLSLPQETDYTSKPYRKALHLLHIHSWAPAYYDIDRLKLMSSLDLAQPVAPGAMLFTENTLGTFSGMVGYSFTEGRHAAHAQFTYQGLRPIFSFSMHLNERAQEFTSFAYDAEQKTLLSAKTFTDKPFFNAQALVYLPFSFVSKGWIRQLIPSMRLLFDNDRYGLTLGGQIDHRIRVGLTYKQQRAKAQWDIFPRWGFGVELLGQHSIGMNRHFAQVYSAGLHAYTPGFARNHAFLWRVAGQHNVIHPSTLFFQGSVLRTTRSDYDPMGENMCIASVDYAFPLAACHWSLPHFLYIKRWEAKPFVDAQWTSGYKGWHIAPGAELTARFHLFRIGTELNGGLRAVYDPAHEKMIWKAVFNVDAF